MPINVDGVHVIAAPVAAQDSIEYQSRPYVFAKVQFSLICGAPVVLLQPAAAAVNDGVGIAVTICSTEENVAEAGAVVAVLVMPDGFMLTLNLCPTTAEVPIIIFTYRAFVVPTGTMSWEADILNACRLSTVTVVLPRNVDPS